MTNTATKTLLDRAPIARQHIARNLDLEDLAKDPAIATMTRKELEKAIYQFAEDAYWTTVLAAEDGDLLLSVEIEENNINDENELADWDEALEDRFTPVEWRYARREIDKVVFIVPLSRDQVAYCCRHGFRQTIEDALKKWGWIDKNDHIDCIGDAMDRDPFPARNTTGKEVA